MKEQTMNDDLTLEEIIEAAAMFEKLSSDVQEELLELMRDMLKQNEKASSWLSFWEPLKTGTRADFVHDLYQMLGAKPQ